MHDLTFLRNVLLVFKFIPQILIASAVNGMLFHATGNWLVSAKHTKFKNQDWPQMGGIIDENLSMVTANL